MRLAGAFDGDVKARRAVARASIVAADESLHEDERVQKDSGAQLEPLRHHRHQPVELGAHVPFRRSWLTEDDVGICSRPQAILVHELERHAALGAAHEAVHREHERVEPP